MRVLYQPPEIVDEDLVLDNRTWKRTDHGYVSPDLDQETASYYTNLNGTFTAMPERDPGSKKAKTDEGKGEDGGKAGDKKPEEPPPEIEGKCNALTLKGVRCKRKAGWQTDHPGEGHCRAHDGKKE